MVFQKSTKECVECRLIKLVVARSVSFIREVCAKLWLHGWTNKT